MRILYLDLDAMNPSHLSCYGYPRQTSPRLDAFAESARRFEEYYTSDAPCLPSRTAFYSGRFGIQTGVVGHGGSAAQPKVQGKGRGFRDHFDDNGLARQLQLLGCKTALISSFGQRHAAWHFYAGFNEVHNTGRGGMEIADDVTPLAEDWLDRQGKQDHWYLHVNYWDVHTPYRIPMGYGDPFADQPLPDWMTPAWKRFKLKAGPHSALDLGMYGDEAWEKYPRVPPRLDTAENLKRYIDAYDASIHYLDSHLGRLFDKLEALGIVDDTHVIVSADHGECQGDLGIYGEHGTADRGTCRIPMLFRGPGVQPGVDRDLHYHLDLAPTLMDLLGGSTPALWDGQSFHASLTEGAPVGRDSLVLGQCAHVCQRSVRFGDHLYIRTYHDGFHGFPQEMLFDLASDPHEQINLSDQRPERCREALAMLTNWHDAQMHRIAENANDAVDPLWTVIHEGGPFHAKAGCGGAPADLNDYVRRLTDTGRSAPASLQRAAARRDA